MSPSPGGLAGQGGWQNCKTCTHPELDAIDAALEQGLTLAVAIERWGPAISRAGLSRHRAHHQKLVETPTVSAGRFVLLDVLGALQDRHRVLEARMIAATRSSAGGGAQFVQLSRESRAVLDQIARVQADPDLQKIPRLQALDRIRDRLLADEWAALTARALQLFLATLDGPTPRSAETSRALADTVEAMLSFEIAKLEAELSGQPVPPPSSVDLDSAFRRWNERRLDREAEASTRKAEQAVAKFERDVAAEVERRLERPVLAAVRALPSAASKVGV